MSIGTRGGGLWAADAGVGGWCVCRYRPARFFRILLKVSGETPR
jgi:hypothetical protein